MGLTPQKLLTQHNISTDRLVLLTEVGSTAHGIRSTSEDTDYTAVFVQTFSELVNGVNESRMVRTAGEGERSGPDDIDINVYSLRRFAKLAQNGNPSILAAIFSEKYLINKRVAWGELEDLILSKRVGYAFLGYMNEQLSRWEGKASKRVNRPELVAAHGYDTKYASHVIRLGGQGVEYMQTGRFEVPMDPIAADFLTTVRAGNIEESVVRSLAGQLQKQLIDEIEKSKFPEKGAPIDDWLTDHYSRLI